MDTPASLGQAFLSCGTYDDAVQCIGCARLIDSNLPRLLNLMLNEHPNRRGDLRDRFEDALITCAVHDKVEQGLHLDDAWAYMVSNPSRIHKIKDLGVRVLMGGKYTFLNKGYAPSPKRLLAAMMISERRGSRTELADKFFEWVEAKSSGMPSLPSSDAPAALKELASIDADSMTFLRSRFERIANKPLPPLTEHRKSVFDHLFTTHPQQVGFASILLKSTFDRLLSKHIHVSTNDVNNAFDWITHAQGRPNQVIVVEAFANALNRSTSSGRDYSKRDIESSLEAMQLTQSRMDEVCHFWRLIASNRFAGKETDLLSSPALLSQYPHNNGNQLVWLSCKKVNAKESYGTHLFALAVVMDVDTEVLIELFKEDSKTLLELHTYRPDERFLKLMNQQDRRTSLMFSLDM